MIDWQKILKDLQRQYKSLAKIGLELDICPSTLQKVARLGCEYMMYRHGVKILALHLKHCKETDVGFNQHQTKEYHEQLDWELNALKDVLIEPMSITEMRQIVTIKSFPHKLAKFVSDGDLYTKRVKRNNNWLNLYSLQPFEEEIKPSNPTSRIYRLTDTVHIKSNQSRNKVYVAGASLNNF